MIENLKENVRFGIITIRDDEYREVLRLLPTTSIVDGAGERRYRMAELICHNGNRVSVALTRCIEQGTVEAQKVASEFIRDLNPKWIFVVGIAGGVPDSEFSLGDVVISSRVYDLTLESASSGGHRDYSIKGQDLHKVSKKLIADLPGLLDRELKDWHKFLNMERPSYDLESIDQNVEGDEIWKNKVRDSLIENFSIDRPPLALVGSIVSSDRLIKDPQLIADWRNSIKNFMAVEMESAGVCRTVEDTPVVVIRGISDIVGLKREPNWTTYACKTAAAFTISLICSGNMPTWRSKGDARVTQLPLAKIIPYQDRAYGYAYFKKNGDIYRLRAYPIKYIEMHKAVFDHHKMNTSLEAIREGYRLIIANPTNCLYTILSVDLKLKEYNELPERYVCLWNPRGIERAHSVELELSPQREYISILDPNQYISLEANESAVILIEIKDAYPGIYQLEVHLKAYKPKGIEYTIKSNIIDLFVPHRETDNSNSRYGISISGLGDHQSLSERLLSLDQPNFTKLALSTNLEPWFFQSVSSNFYRDILNLSDNEFIARLDRERQKNGQIF